MNFSISSALRPEFGQPMHGYDLDTIEGSEIVVRCAEKDEKFVPEREGDDSIYKGMHLVSYFKAL